MQDENLFSPFMAGIHELSELKLMDFLRRFNSQPDKVRSFITSMDTYAAIKKFSELGVIPANYAVAIAKLILLLAFNEIQIGQIDSLLRKLNLEPKSIPPTIGAIHEILRPLHDQQVPAQATRDSIPLAIAPLPPLTISKSIPVPTPPSRTTIDLRDKKLSS